MKARSAGRLLTALQSKALDIKAGRISGISTLVLMENAGRQVAEEALRLYRGGMRVAIFCGRGNNGGDGFVAARHLHARGISPDCFLIGKIADVRDEARVNLDILLKLKVRLREVSDAGYFSRRMPYGLIVDALLGVGAHGAVNGVYAACIDSINSSSAKVLSVDIPSGLDATTGKILGHCVTADTTVTFVAKKRGMTVHAGPSRCGNVVVADIGIRI